MSSARPFFSVVIPLYNKEAYIAATLQSVFIQTFQNFEVIVVNDGSTDRSVDALKHHSDNRLKFFSKQNGGVSSARNYGIDRAQGDYVAFLDADDTWEPAYLGSMKKLIEQYPGSGLYIAAHYVIEQKKRYTIGNGLPEGVILNLYRAELESHIIRISATIAPIEVLKNIGGFPVGMVSGEDAFLCALIAPQHKIIFTPKPLVTYNNIFSGKDLRYDKVDTCVESWCDLYEEGNYYKNEFIAVKAIKAGVRSALGFCKEKSRKIEHATRYTVASRREWLYLFFLNRLPYSAIRLYKQAKPFISRFKQFTFKNTMVQP